MNRLLGLLWLIATPLAAIGILTLFLPALLTMAGLNHPYTGPKYEVRGKRALIITTSHGTLGDTGRKTGVYASEMTVPYYTFLEGGMKVDIASIQGGKIPIEPSSLRWPLLASEDRRFLEDADFKSKVDNSLKIDDLILPNMTLFSWRAAGARPTISAFRKSSAES